MSGRTQVQGKSSNLYAQSTYSTYIWIFQYISDEKHHEKDVSCRCNNWGRYLNVYCIHYRVNIKTELAPFRPILAIFTNIGCFRQFWPFSPNHIYGIYLYYAMHIMHHRYIYVKIIYGNRFLEAYLITAENTKKMINEK